MAIRTVLTERFGLTWPVVLAPMAFVSGGALARAVTAAGGLGFVGGGYGDRTWLSRELAAAGNDPVGVGFITWSLAKDPDLLALALDHAPRAVSLSFGDIRPFAARVKRQGVPLIAQVQSVEMARAAAGEGVDFIVAQGTEAGGHGAARATLPLVPAIVDAVGGVPVIAAGGIADGRGLAAALMLGAAGVVCGTAFYVAEESLAAPAAKAVAVAVSGAETGRSSVYDVVRGFAWPSPFDIRLVENPFISRWKRDGEGLARDVLTERARYDRALAEGDMSVAAVIVGEGIDMVRSVEPAAGILARMGQGAERLLSGAGALVALAAGTPQGACRL
jgi:nitronate monooxygenase